MLPEFLAAAILIELTPGPNMAWLALLGASRGRFAALTAVVGVATVIHAAIALLAGSFNRFFADRARARILGRVFALLLTAVAVWFFYATEMKS